MRDFFAIDATRSRWPTAKNSKVLRQEELGFSKVERAPWQVRTGKAAAAMRGRHLGAGRRDH